MVVMHHDMKKKNYLCTTQSAVRCTKSYYNSGNNFKN